VYTSKTLLNSWALGGDYGTEDQAHASSNSKVHKLLETRPASFPFGSPPGGAETLRVRVRQNGLLTSHPNPSARGLNQRHPAEDAGDHSGDERQLSAARAEVWILPNRPNGAVWFIICVTVERPGTSKPGTVIPDPSANAESEAKH
jgi:hypothetical protein